MKKLLLLLLSVGVNASEADLPIVSKTGLEGIASNGIRIAVETAQIGAVDTLIVENKVKICLLQNGIEFTHKNPLRLPSTIYVNPYPIKDREGTMLGWMMFIKVSRATDYENNGKKFTTEAAVYTEMALAPPEGLTKILEAMLDKFIVAYLKANPKKKEQ